MSTSRLRSRPSAVLYVLTLGPIVHSHGKNFHCYADDAQLFVPMKEDYPARWHSFTQTHCDFSL